MVKLIFWFSFLVIVYAYFGYPFILLFLSRFKKVEIIKRPFEPSISLIIPVFNGGWIISEKLENTLQLEYPGEKLEVIVSSDGSTDRTDSIVQEFENRRVKLVALPLRQGKAAALNRGLEGAIGDIIVFSDASIMLDRGSLREIVKDFASNEIGCVSGEDHIISGNGGEGMYGKYELFLRRLESRLSSIVGASGCFYAQRRNLVERFPAGIAPDFFSVLGVVKKGYRAVSDPDATGFMKSVPTAGEELSRKVRTILRGIRALFYHKSLLNPFQYKLFSFQLISHKLVRWMVPLFMITLFLANLFLVGSRMYSIFLAIQLVFYGLAVFGLKSAGPAGVRGIVRIPCYLLVSNMAIIIAWMKYFSGETQDIWEPSVRTQLLSK